MNFLSLNPSEITLIILGICIIPIVLLMVYAIVVAVKRSRIRQSKREVEALSSDDITQKELFYKIFGGKDNITGINQTMSRISVDVENIENVKVDELKEIGATGVLLVGNTVKCSFGDRATYIYELLKNNNGEE
jgi:PTS system D-glucosamine-specific IIC component